MSHKSAIIGFGGMGHWHYENITKRIDAIDVKGVFDVRDERLELAEKEGLFPYKSLEEVLNDKEVDIVTVATPNNFHKDISIACLRAGKNVISEKPVTMNSAELEEIIKVRNETGKLFAVHQNRRWDKDFRIVKKAIEDNMIGKPFYIESRVQGSGGTLHGWRGAKINGGGMLYDWGIHLIDQIMWLIDSPVVEIMTHMFKVKSDECDDNFKMFLRFENGISAHVQVDTYCFINLPRWHVSGDAATIVVNDWECNGKIVKAKEGATEWSENIVYTAAGPTRTMAPRKKETIEELSLPEVQTSWTDFYNNIVDVIDNGADLIVKPEQSLRVMKVIDAGFESERIGKSIRVNV